MDAAVYQVNKASLHIQEQGAGEIGCLLIHGFGDGLHVWTPFVPSIAEQLRTVTVELRGHGDSPWSPSGEYSIDQHLSDVLQTIDALPIERWVLIGHSLGGELAIRIAQARADKVVGLVVVDFGPELYPDGVERVLTDFRGSVRPWSSRDEYMLWLQSRRPLLDPAMYAILARHALREHPEGGFHIKCDPALSNQEQRVRNAPELWAMLEKIVCPTLVVRGLGSAVLPHPVAQKMTQVLRKGSLRIVDRAGHAVMTDNPQAFAQVLYPFLRQLQTD